MVFAVSFFGVAFSILAWVPCSPPSAYWHVDDTITASVRCWGFADNDANIFESTFVSHAAINAVFDFIIFFVALRLLLQPGAKMKKMRLGLIGILMVGAL